MTDVGVANMFHLSKYCYVCFSEKSNLQRIENTFANAVLLEKLDYCSFNIKRTKLLQYILICGECCHKLHIAYDFITMCHKNSSRLQGYVSHLEHTTVLNENQDTGSNDTFDYDKAKLNSTRVGDSLQQKDAMNMVENINEPDPTTDNINYNSALMMKIKDEIMSEDESLEEESSDTHQEIQPEFVALPEIKTEYDSTDYESTSVTDPQQSSGSTKQNSTPSGTSSFKSDDPLYRPHACSTCPKRFHKKSCLRQHEIIHTGLKPFICSTCGKCFNNKAALMRHEIIHTGEKPFKCEQCGKCFNQKASLKDHELIHTGVKPHKCLTCLKGFHNKTALRRHELIHTDEKPYKCSLCGKSFNQKASLKDHDLIHTGVKPYTCSTCPKSFIKKANLDRHESLHRGKRPFTCSICFARFATEVNLNSHTSMYHEFKPTEYQEVKPIVYPE